MRVKMLSLFLIAAVAMAQSKLEDKSPPAMMILPR